MDDEPGFAQILCRISLALLHRLGEGARVGVKGEEGGDCLIAFGGECCSTVAGSKLRRQDDGLPGGQRRADDGIGISGIAAVFHQIWKNTWAHAW